MKRWYYWFPKRTVKRIVTVIQQTKNMEQLKEQLTTQFMLNSKQIDYLLTFRLHELAKNQRDTRHEFIQGLKTRERE